MNFSSWIEFVKKNGGIDYDGSYGRQCVDLVQHYAEKVLGISGAFYGLNYAYEIYTKYSKLNKINKNFKLIDAEVYGEYPKRGDIIVWSKKKNGYAGHTAVCINCDETGFTVLEQNYDGNGSIREHKYSYYLVNGWLRPIKKIEDYGNATINSYQFVYSDSLLTQKIGSISSNERVYYEGVGNNNSIIVYKISNGYKCGFIKGKPLTLD